MSFLGSLFATPETIGKGVDAVINAGDALVFTDEEKAEHNSRMRDWYIKYLDSTTGSALARRMIAVGVTALWSINIIVVLIAKALGCEDYATFAFDVLTDVVAIPFGVIVAFYFLKPVAIK